ncbi:MAG: DUF58 domain-containing protein [Firmicutes bacterium]|nr:DUF58 domain-containing protein [Bacillota bacterium]
MKNCRVITTTPIAGFPARMLLILLLLLTIYFRLKLFYLAVLLYLMYLLWSYYWTITSCRYVDSKAKNLRHNIFAGETFSLEFKLANAWHLPVVRSRINITLPIFFTVVADNKVFASEEPKKPNAEKAGNVIVPRQQYFAAYSWLPAKEEVNLAVEVKAQLRGVYYIPAVEFFVGDPSGLFYAAKEITRGSYLYVYPRIQEKEEINRVLALTEKQVERGTALEDRYTVLGVRSYQLTDPLKSINWYATARTGSLKSNLYARKNSFNCLIVFDLSVYEQPPAETDFIPTEDPLLEEAISFATSLALFQLEQGVKTAFYTNAPLLQWQRGRETNKPPYLKRVRRISALTFAASDEQAQKILKLAASIDESSRASREEQEKLWLKVMEKASDSMVYILTYNRPPACWDSAKDKTAEKKAENPHDFYTAARLAALACAGYRLINLN